MAERAEAINMPPEPVSEKVIRWVTRASVAGLVISLVVHITFLFVSGAIKWREGGGGGGGTPTGPVELAVITATELSAMENAPVSMLAPGVDEPTDQQTSAMAATPSIESAGGQAPDGTGELGGLGDGLGGAGDGTGIGLGDGTGGAGGGGAKFFGVEARGQRFVYIVDISGSMSEGAVEGPRKIDGLKAALIASIDGLGEGAQFLVLPFESDTRPLLNRERWTDAGDRNKRLAIGAVQQLTAAGGTNPSPAFTTAFMLKPRPDAIYFMTDGIFDEGAALRIALMNKTEPKVPIHTIAFGDNAAIPLMQRIAKESGGTYKKVEAPGP